MNYTYTGIAYLFIIKSNYYKLFSYIKQRGNDEDKLFTFSNFPVKYLLIRTIKILVVQPTK